MWKIHSVFWIITGCILYVFRHSNGQEELGDIGCHRGSYRHGDFCYVVWPLRQSHYDAETICKTSGGSLAMIKNSETHTFLQKMYIRKIFHNFWFGLNDKNSEGKWVFSDNTSLSTFNEWDRGQPDNLGKNQHCAHMWMFKNLQWDDATCSGTMRYICEFNAFKCGNQFPSYGQSCYELSKDFATHIEAEVNCQNRGGILAIIKNEGIHNFLKKTIYAERFWLNMTQEDLQSVPQITWNPGVWVGIQFRNDNWIYSDGAPLTFTSWAPGRPDSDQSKACVKLTSSIWSNEKCNAQSPFICQYPVNVNCESPPTSSNFCSSCSGSFTVKSSFSVEVFHDDRKIHESHSIA